MDLSRSEELFIPVVLGSVRKNRRSLRPAQLLVGQANLAGHQSELIDLRASPLPLYGMEDDGKDHPSVQQLRETIARSDAVVWLTPEYNHTYTSAIKNAIDYVGSEIHRKPVAVCGLSGGVMGGVRAVEQLKLVLLELRCLPIRESVYFSGAETLFDDAGTLQRPEFLRRIDEVIADLAWYARCLKWGREHLPVPSRGPK